MDIQLRKWKCKHVREMYQEICPVDICSHAYKMITWLRVVCFAPVMLTFLQAQSKQMVEFTPHAVCTENTKRTQVVQGQGYNDYPQSLNWVKEDART